MWNATSPIGVPAKTNNMEKKKIYDAAAKYVENSHSQADNDFQNTMNIAAVKAFIAGAKCVIEENICLNCKASKDCNKYIKL